MVNLLNFCKANWSPVPLFIGEGMYSSIVASSTSADHAINAFCIKTAGKCMVSLPLLSQKVAEVWLTVVVHPKSYSWCIPTKRNPKLTSLVIMRAILKHPDNLLTCHGELCRLCLPGHFSLRKLIIPKLATDQEIDNSKIAKIWLAKFWMFNFKIVHFAQFSLNFNDLGLKL